MPKLNNINDINKECIYYMKFKLNNSITIYLILASFVTCMFLNNPITYATGNGYIPIEVTGFNKDVVISNSIEYEKTNAVDFDDNIESNYKYAFYSSSYRDTNDNYEYEDEDTDYNKEHINMMIANGEGIFPNNEIITTSTGKNFKIQPSGNKNTIQISTNNTTETLTLVDKVSYNKIAFLVTGGGGEPEILATIKYIDGTESNPLSVIAYDWYSGPEDKKIYSNLGRVNISSIAQPYQGHVEILDWQGLKAGLYEYVISGLDINKKIDSIKFDYYSGSGIANIFAVSGLIDDSVEIPTVLPATNITDNSFTANWTQTSNAVKYCLDVDTDVNFSNTVINGQIVTTNYYNIENLKSGIKYYYRVYAITESDRSNYSDIMSISTIEDAIDIIPNPKTGDNIIVYDVLFVISVISIILIIAINNKKYRIKI